MLKYLSFILIFLSACRPTKDLGIQETLDDDKCYGKSLVMNQRKLINTDTIKLPVYTGQNLHPNQLDSLLKYYYHHDESGIVKNEPVAVVIDTFYKSQFTWKTFVYGTLDAESEDKTIWQEIVCQEDLSPSLLNQLRLALRARGYYGHIPVDESIVDGPLKSSLVRFQEDNKLRTGQLDIESLKKLGVELK